MPVTSRPSNFNQSPNPYNLRSQTPKATLLPAQASGTSRLPVWVVVQASELQREPEAAPEPDPHPNIRMAAYRLECFRGDSTQDIDAYLRRFEQYRKCTNITNEASAIATLAWHFNESARLWFDSLETKPASLNDFKALLTGRFKQDKVLDLSIYSTQQFVDKKVMDYL